MRLDARDAVALDDDVDVLARRRVRPSNSRPACTVVRAVGRLRRPRRAAARCRATLPSTTIDQPEAVGCLIEHAPRVARSTTACWPDRATGAARGPSGVPSRATGTRRAGRRRSPPSACRRATRPARVLAHADRLVRHRDRTSGRANVPRRSATCRAATATHSTWFVPSRNLVEYGRSADITTARPSGDQLGRPGSFKPSCAWRIARASPRRRPAAAIAGSRKAMRAPSGDHAADIARGGKLAIGAASQVAHPQVHRRRRDRSRTRAACRPATTPDRSTNASLVRRCGVASPADGRHEPQIAERGKHDRDAVGRDRRVHQAAHRLRPLRRKRRAALA